MHADFIHIDFQFYLASQHILLVIVQDADNFFKCHQLTPAEVNFRLARKSLLALNIFHEVKHWQESVRFEELFLGRKSDPKMDEILVECPDNPLYFLFLSCKVIHSEYKFQILYSCSLFIKYGN